MSTPNAPQPTLADFAFIHCLAESLLDQAARVGIILTIERKSLAPLAMGHTCAEIRTWPGRTKQKAQGVPDPNCKCCEGTGVDGDCGDDGRAIDVDCSCRKASAEPQAEQQAQTQAPARGCAE